MRLDHFGDTKNGVVTFGGFQSLILSAEDFEEEVLGAGLAIGAGDADDGEVGVFENAPATGFLGEKTTGKFVGFDDHQ